MSSRNEEILKSCVEGGDCTFKPQSRIEALLFALKEKINAIGDGGGGGASGGLSIKSITFTDRPSAYEWLLSNADKVIKTTLASNQTPVPMNYNTMYITYRNDWSNIEFLLGTTIVTVGVVSGDADVVGMFAMITSDAVEVIMSPKYISFSNENDEISSVSDSKPTTIPDAYWSAMEASLTFYYID